MSVAEEVDLAPVAALKDSTNVITDAPNGNGHLANGEDTTVNGVAVDKEAGNAEPPASLVEEVEAHEEKKVENSASSVLASESASNDALVEKEAAIEAEVTTDEPIEAVSDVPESTASKEIEEDMSSKDVSSSTITEAATSTPATEPETEATAISTVETPEVPTTADVSTEAAPVKETTEDTIDGAVEPTALTSTEEVPASVPEVVAIPKDVETPVFVEDGAAPVETEVPSKTRDDVPSAEDIQKEALEDSVVPSVVETPVTEPQVTPDVAPKEPEPIPESSQETAEPVEEETRAVEEEKAVEETKDAEEVAAVEEEPKPTDENASGLPDGLVVLSTSQDETCYPSDVEATQKNQEGILIIKELEVESIAEQPVAEDTKTSIVEEVKPEVVEASAESTHEEKQIADETTATPLKESAVKSEEVEPEGFLVPEEKEAEAEVAPDVTPAPTEELAVKEEAASPVEEISTAAEPDASPAVPESAAAVDEVVAEASAIPAETTVAELAPIEADLVPAIDETSVEPTATEVTIVEPAAVSEDPLLAVTSVPVDDAPVEAAILTEDPIVPEEAAPTEPAAPVLEEATPSAIEPSELAEPTEPVVEKQEPDESAAAPEPLEVEPAATEQKTTVEPTPVLVEEILVLQEPAAAELASEETAEESKDVAPADAVKDSDALAAQPHEGEAAVDTKPEVLLVTEEVVVPSNESRDQADEATPVEVAETPIVNEVNASVITPILAEEPTVAEDATAAETESVKEDVSAEDYLAANSIAVSADVAPESTESSTVPTEVPTEPEAPVVEPAELSVSEVDASAVGADVLDSSKDEASEVPAAVPQAPVQAVEAEQAVEAPADETVTDATPAIPEESEEIRPALTENASTRSILSTEEIPAVQELLASESKTEEVDTSAIETPAIAITPDTEETEGAAALEINEEREIERPKSPWTPSYSVTIQGPGTTVADDAEEIAELEQLPPSVNVPEVTIEAAQATEEVSTEAEAVPADDIPKSSSWPVSYAVSSQGTSPLNAPQQTEDAEADAIEPLSTPKEPVVDQSEARPAIEEPESIKEAAVDEPIAEEPEVAKEETVEAEVPEPTIEVTEAIEDTPVPALQVETESDKSAAEDSPEVAEPVAERPWTPSYSVSHQGASPVQTPKELEEVAPAQAAESGSEEIPTSIPAVQVVGEDEQPVAENIADSTEPAVERPWTPSYSVSHQGASPSQSAKDLEDESNVAAEVSEQQSKISVPALHVEDEPEQPAAVVADETTEAVVERPWTPSYSVSQQGTSPLQTPKKLNSAESVPVDDKEEQPTAVVPALQVQSEAEQTATETTAEIVEPVPERLWTPSYLVSHQGASPLQTSKELGETLESGIAASAVAYEEPVLPEAEVSKVSEPEPAADIQGDVEPASDTPIIALSDVNAAEPDVTEGLEEASARAAEGAAIERPWTPSYAVTQQGSSPLGIRAVQTKVLEEVPAPVNQGDHQELISEAPGAGIETAEKPLITVEAADAPSTESHDTESELERPERPWTPSYSVTRQGSGTHTPEAVENAERQQSTEAVAKPEIIVNGTSGVDTLGESQRQAFPTTEVSENGPKTVSMKPSLARLTPVNENEQIDPTSPPDLETVSPTSGRTRLESTTSSRFFPGGWFSSTPKSAEEGRTSLDHASGVFSKTNGDSASPALEAPANTPIDGDHHHHHHHHEKKSRWCVIM